MQVPIVGKNKASCSVFQTNKHIEHFLLLFSESLWTEWTEWTCNIGSNILSRSRHCPVRAYLSRGTCPFMEVVVEEQPCQGERRQTIYQISMPQVFSNEGMWGSWILMGPCSTTCEEGTRIRTRSCDSPAPMSESEDCLHMNGTRGLIDNDLAFPCDFGSCTGNTLLDCRLSCWSIAD